MSMVTTRGCPFHCNWCAKPIWVQRYNSCSPENVVAEMRRLNDHYRPDHLWFMDDIMGLKPGWLEHFSELVELSGFKIPFKSLNRADLLLRSETIHSLQRAGAQEVWLGAESGSQRLLDAMEKGTQVDQIYAAAHDLQVAGIKVGFFLQFECPGEQCDNIEKTLQMVRDCQPDDIGISVSYPLPGTKFYKSVSRQLSTKQNRIDSRDLEMLYQGPFTTGFYRKLHTVVHKEFRIRKGWDEIRKNARQPTNFRLNDLRRVLRVALRLVTLPLDRWLLNRLARFPHQGVSPLHLDLSPTAEAQPTPGRIDCVG